MMAAIVTAIMIVAIVLRCYHITEQPLQDDEVSAAFTAVNYMENGHFGPTMWFHPNLRNVVLYPLGEFFGYGPLAIRTVSALAGILSVLLLGLLLFQLTGDRRAALVAAFFLAVEEVHIMFSRQAVQETWTLFFILLGIVLFVGYEKRDRPWLLVLSGLAFGLGLASKLHAAFPLAVCALIAVTTAVKERSLPRAVFATSALVLLPATVYLATYFPWFLRGYGVGDFFLMQTNLLKAMAIHMGNPMDQTIDVRAWEWFLKPVGYGTFVLSQGKPFVSIAFTNPFAWLAVLPSAALIVHKIRKKSGDAESRNLLFLVLLFGASYLPLVVLPRPVWLLSALAVVPFGFMIVAYVFSDWSRRVRWGNNILVIYMVIVVISSLALYPLAIGKAKTYHYLSDITERFRPEFEQRQ